MGTIENLGVELQKELFILQTCNEDASEMHSHPFFEFVYVLKGRAEHTINDRTMILSEGDYFFIDLNCHHQYRKLSEEKEFCVVNCMFLPQFIDASLSRTKDFFSLAAHCSKDFSLDKSVTLSSYHDGDGFVGALIQRMMREYRDKKVGGAEILRNSLSSLIVCLVRNGNALSESGSERLTRSVKMYAEQNYKNDIRLSDIAKELNFSLTYVSITFKRECGMTFCDYLKKIRLERACRYLRTTDMTVAEIAELVGYADAAFFFKIFKKELGVTPGAYRKIQKG